MAEAAIPERGVDHLGDCDFHGDRLYVAMEGTTPARIGLFDPDHLSVYRPIHDSGSLVLHHLREIELRNDDGSPLRLERVHAVDVASGRRLLHGPLPSDWDGADRGIVEGLAITPLHGPEPWLQGTVHVLVLGRRDGRTDRVWLRQVGPGRSGKPSRVRRTSDKDRERAEELAREVAEDNPDPTTRREAIELALEDEGLSEEGEEIGQHNE